MVANDFSMKKALYAAWADSCPAPAYVLCVGDEVLGLSEGDWCRAVVTSVADGVSFTDYNDVADRLDGVREMPGRENFAICMFSILCISTINI